MSSPTTKPCEHLTPARGTLAMVPAATDEVVIDLDAEELLDTDADHGDQADHAGQSERPRSTRRTRAAGRPRSHTGSRGRSLELRRQNRARRYERLEALFAWAKMSRRPVHTDALLMIVECEGNFETWPPDCWTEHGLWQFLWSEVNTACVLAGRREPRGMAESMWLYLEYLDQSEGFAAGSDPLAKLQSFLQEYGDLTEAGAPRTPDDSPQTFGQFQLDLEPAA